MPLFSPMIKAFKRLRPSDGLLITAESWQQTQDYHRERQNFYYQSLHQAGIVHGLGVTVVEAPAEVEARYRNQRWVQVQSGIAIDAQGNPIVVVEPVTFQVQSTGAAGEEKTVYLVLNYVDPQGLRSLPGQQEPWIQETFRIREKASLDVLDVELCRLQLTAGATALVNATDVFAPEVNSLDLRYRRPIHDRPAGLLQVAQLGNATAIAAEVHQGLTYLCQALPALYPLLAAEPILPPWPITESSRPDFPPDCDLVYLSHRELSQISPALQTQLQHHLTAGGVLLIGVDDSHPRQRELAQIKRELETSLAEADTDPGVASIAAAVETEITAIAAEMNQFTQSRCRAVLQLMTELHLSVSGTGQVPLDHPLYTTPFLFSRLPEVDAQPVQLFTWGGVVLVIGHLAAAWGPDPTGQRSREAIRSAHELGINLLHYAWRRRQLIQCQQQGIPTATAPQPISLTRQVTS